MIFGIGTDILQQSRIAKTWDRFGMRFVDHLLLDDEKKLFISTKNPVRFLAMRFAAKESIVKAMGTGFSHGVWIRDVGTLPNQWGNPRRGEPLAAAGRRSRRCGRRRSRRAWRARSRGRRGRRSAAAPPTSPATES